MRLIARQFLGPTFESEFEHPILSNRGRGTVICPFFWKRYATLPLLAKLPWFFEKISRRSAAVRFLLSVATSMSSATPPERSLRKEALRAWPRFTLAGAPPDRAVNVVARHALCARSEDGTPQARFPAGSPPPILAATVISFASFEKSLPRFWSRAPLRRLTLDHLLCPAMESGKNIGDYTRTRGLLFDEGDLSDWTERPLTRTA